MPKLARDPSLDSGVSRGGFSIPELLAVLVVTGILATLAIVASRLPRARAEMARLTAEAYNLQVAQEAYRADHGRPYDGPFTTDAIRAAGFNYTPPPDLTITVESVDPTAWQARLTGGQLGTNGQANGPSCRLALSGATSIACTLSPTHEEGLQNDQPSGPSQAPERIPVNQ
jgi:prepilin-type N-terminal cleavage/methylation domain-containing protein